MGRGTCLARELQEAAGNSDADANRYSPAVFNNV